MAELDAHTREQLRALTGPSPADREALLASIWARVDVADPDPDGDPDPDPDLGPPQTGASGAGVQASQAFQALWIAKIVGATAMLTGAGLIAVRLTAVGLGLTGGESPRPAPSEQSASGVSAETSADTPPHEDEPAPSPTATEDMRPPDAPERPASSNTGRKTSAQVDASPREPDSGTLAKELALLQAAKDIAASDPAGALAKLDRHRQDFPTGVLAPERELLRVELLCVLGRPDQAAVIAKQLRRDHAGSPLLDRLASSCVDH